MGNRKDEKEVASKKLKKKYVFIIIASIFIFDIYENADKGTDSNVVLSNETILEIQSKVSQTGCPVYTSVLYSDMKNYKKMGNYFAACLDGKSGSIMVYKIRADGGIGRMKYIFDGTDMFVLSANAVWNEENQAEISDVSHSRIKEWRYSKKGWFCYEMCVPEYPEVTNIKENEDGTVTLTVDAVCEMILCDDSVITHELTKLYFR